MLLLLLLPVLLLLVLLPVLLLLALLPVLLMLLLSLLTVHMEICTHLLSQKQPLAGKRLMHSHKNPQRMMDCDLPRA